MPEALLQAPRVELQKRPRAPSPAPANNAEQPDIETLTRGAGEKSATGAVLSLPTPLSFIVVTRRLAHPGYLPWLYQPQFSR